MPKRKPILTEREEEILAAIYTYRYLTVSQVTRLFFSPRSQNHAGAYLKRLADEKWLLRFTLPATSKGNHEFIYALSQQSLQYLASLGKDIEGQPPALQPAPSYQHLRHCCVSNDIMIAATLLPRLVPAIEMRDMKTEWLLKKQPVRVQLPPTAASQQTGRNDHQTVSVIPDGWIDFRLLVGSTRMRLVLWLELDLGTEEQKQFRRKTAALHTIATNKDYKEQLGVKEITLAFVSGVGEKRQAEMTTWIVQELKARHKMQDVDLFLLTSLPQGDILDPEMFFLSPVWTSPASATRLPLIDLSL